MEHGKTPWKMQHMEQFHSAGEFGIEIVSADGNVIADNQTYYPAAISEHDARRIVACINACSHIPTDRLEMAMPGQMKSSLDGLCDSVERLTDQRDELLAVLEAMLEEVAGCYCTTEAAARAVIQKVRGGE